MDRLHILVVLFAIVLASGCVSEPSADSNPDEVRYEQGNSKSQGNYLATDFQVDIQEKNSSFDVVDSVILAENTLSSNVELSTIALEFRQGNLPSLEARKDSWNRRGEFNSQFDNKIMDGERIRSGEQSQFNLAPGEDLKNLEYGCYNVSLVMRESKGLPSQGSLGDPTNFYVAGLNSFETCIGEGDTHSKIERVSETESVRLNRAAAPPKLERRAGILDENPEKVEEHYNVSYATGDYEQIVIQGTDLLKSSSEGEERIQQVKDSATDYSEVETFSEDTNLIILGNISDTDNRFQNKDVNIMVDMRNKDLHSTLLIDIKDTSTIDTERVIDNVATKMDVNYRGDELEQALRNRYN